MNAADITATSHATVATGRPKAKGRVHLVLGLIVLGVYWIINWSVFQVEMAMFPRFMTRALSSLVLLLFFGGWWLSNRQMIWRDRWLGLAGGLAGFVVAALAADKSFDPFALAMLSFPITITAAMVWTVASRGQLLGAQRVGLAAIVVMFFGYFAMLRWDGLDGLQRNKLSWRWTPTAEQLFLTERSAHAAMPLAASGSCTLRVGDWPEFRGPDRDGVVPGQKLAVWDDPPEPLWRQRVGPGWASMIVVDGRLITQEQRGEAEAVVCYDAATGREIWAYEDPGRFNESLSGVGPRGTPSFRDGRIYAYGAKAKLSCLSAADGKCLWSRDLLADAAAEMPMWGFSVSPLVVDNLVIAFAGSKEGKQSLVAYLAETGEPRWLKPAGKESYSSPEVVTLGSVRQIVMHDNLTVRGVTVDQGELLWQRPNVNEMAVPMLQPRLVGRTSLLVQHDPGLALVDIKQEAGKWSVTERWTSTSLKPGFNDFVVHKGHLFGLDDGILCCLELETGDRVWKSGRYGHGQLLLLPDADQLLVLTEKGEVVLVSATADDHVELCRFQAIEGKTWNHPVLAHGRLYVRNSEEMACYEIGE